MQPARTARPSRLLRAAVALVVVLLAGVVAAAPAQAVAAYRFWGYFQLTNGAWTFAATGPAQAIPKDGSVEGWRFAVADESSTRTPRATPSFDSLCAAVRVAEGTKRVGLVIDYGRAADSADGSTPPTPRSTCVAVPKKATGSEVLVAADATLRLDKALTCAIDGWPATGCGEKVDPVPAAAAIPDTASTIAAPAPSGSATTSGNPVVNTDGGSSTISPGLVGGLLALVLVIILGYLAWRRSRDATDD